MQSLKKIGIAALSQDNEDAKKMRMMLRSLLKCKKLKTLNISENYLTPACFHVLRDVFLKANTVKYFKFYLASSDRLFNEMFLELQRFNEELIRRGSDLALKQYVLSKGNKMDFRKEIKQECPVVYIGENRQLADIVFQIERARRNVDTVRIVVFSQARLGESKEFALYINDFLKECSNLEQLFIIRTNLGGLMRNSKNVNLFRDLKSTSLKYVNLTCCDLKNPLLERVVLALRPLNTIERLICLDNLELDLQAMQSLFRVKKIKVNVKVDDYICEFPKVHV